MREPLQLRNNFSKYDIHLMRWRKQRSKNLVQRRAHEQQCLAHYTQRALPEVRQVPVVMCADIFDLPDAGFKALPAGFTDAGLAG